MTAITDDNRSAAGIAAWGERFLAAVEASHARAVALLIVVALAAFLPGFVSLQPIDRDEPRFAQASKQMLESGDFVDIRFQDEARHKKPVGIYWLQAATVAVAERLGVPEARTTIALYRLPSLFGALATVVFSYFAALNLGARRREAFLAAAFMGSSILLGIEARFAKTDAVLAACSVVVMGILGRLYVRRGEALGTASLVAFWVAMAVAVLDKGPITPMIAGLAVLALAWRERSARWLGPLRPGIGLLILLVLVAPWFIAIWVKTGGSFFEDAIGKDMLGKVGAGQERHWGPPGAYLVAFFGTFWPAAVLSAIAVPHIWRHRREPWIAFCLAWVIPSWLVFEAVSTKLPHYVLPLYPAIAILTARSLTAGAVGPHRPGAKLAALLIPAIPLGLGLGLSYFAWRYDGAPPYAALPAFAVAVAVAMAAWFFFRRGQVVATALTGIVASLVLWVAVLGLAQPLILSLKVSPRLAAAARGLQCPDPVFATAGYREPSLVFLVGTDLIMTDGRGAAQFLGEGSCRMAFVEAREEGAFEQEIGARGLRPALITRVAGFNVNGGRTLDVGVYAVRP